MSCSNCHTNSSHYPLESPLLCRKCWDLHKYCQQCKLYFPFKKTFSPDELCEHCTRGDKQCRGICSGSNPPVHPIQYPVYCFECSVWGRDRLFTRMCAKCGKNDYVEELNPINNEELTKLPFWPSSL